MDNFLKYVKGQRNDFIKNFWCGNNTKVRILVENLLIAYDQMTEKLQKNQFINSDIENPPESGKYLCLVRLYNSNYYEYIILYFSKKNEIWDVSLSCEEIFWLNLPPAPEGIKIK